jgi:hypothetical protein
VSLSPSPQQFPSMPSSLPLPLLCLKTLCEDILTVPVKTLAAEQLVTSLLRRASTKGSAAPAKASVAPAKNTVRAIPVVGARAVALQARASPTAKAQLQPKVLLRLRKLQLHQRRILLKLLLHLPKTPSELFLQGTRVWLECRI